MISWWKLWPLLVFPFLFYFLAGILMEPLSLVSNVIPITNYSEIFREWSVNVFVLYLLPVSDSNYIINWYMQTNFIGEMLLHLLISVNIGALLLPVMYLIGQGLIKIKTIIHVGELSDLRNQVKNLK